MCGRFAITLPADAVAGLFDAAIGDLPPQEPRYNVCPTQPVMTVRSAEDGRWLETMRWGFLPRWYRSPSDGPLLINARAETIAEKPAFRSSCRKRRCLIPASGFYEWTKAADGGKDPWYTFPADSEIFALAGIWRDWESPDGNVWSTCAIVTCPAMGELSGIHTRMPVIIG
ncbi:MAG: SOS response-associated peptidase, partial [Paracoccaceae bacterium]